MENPVKKYQINQEEKAYTLSTQIFQDNLRFVCIEINQDSPLVFTGEFSLNEIMKFNAIFESITTIEQAQNIFDEIMVNQKVSIELKENYMNLRIFIKKEEQFEEFTIKLNLFSENQIKEESQPIQSVKENQINSQQESINQFVSFGQNINLNSESLLHPSVENSTNLQQEQTTSGLFTSFNPNNAINIDHQIFTSTGSNNNIQQQELASQFMSFAQNNNNMNSELLIQSVPEIQAQGQNISQQQGVTSQTVKTVSYSQNILNAGNENINNVYPTQNTSQGQYIYSAGSQASENYMINTSSTNTYSYENVQTTKTKKQKTEQIILPLMLLPTQPEPAPQIIETNTTQIIEIEKYQNEINRLNDIINQLRSRIEILEQENQGLKLQNTIPTGTGNDEEILFLKQENEKYLREIDLLRSQLSQFEEYKRKKEEEIRMLRLKIVELLEKEKNFNEFMSQKEKQIEELRLYIEELLRNQKLANKQINEVNLEDQMLSIQDTRLEIVKGDIIQDVDELELLTRKMSRNKRKVSLNLLYKATIDSDKAEVFHEKCDQAKSTLVLVKSGNGKRFGGFTTKTWLGNSIEKKDSNAFVFSLDKKKIYDIIEGEDAIGCYPKYGPVFLGCQIRIYDQFFVKGGTSYEKGLNYQTQEDYELTGGLQKFDVKEIEVYSVEIE